MIKVLHLIKSLGRGGAEMLLPEGLRFADRERFDFSYAYFLPWKDAVVPALRDLGAEVTCVSASGNARILLAARRVATLMRASGVDLVHCHLPIAGVVGRIAGRMTGVPVVYTEHNKQERYHPLTRALNRHSWAWQERVIAVSDDVAASIAKHIRSRVPVQVVLNGVDTDRFRRDPNVAHRVRGELGIPESAPVVGTVAVFRQQKRLDHWLDAARRIRDGRPDTQFVIVGDGPLRTEIEAHAALLDLSDVVHFTGLREDVRPFLAAMDVYMMSSVFEGLPVALLEAMSMECVPVATAVGGIPQAIRSGENGYLAEPLRPDLLAERVGDVLGARDRTGELGEAARETVCTRFDMRRMARELESVYETVIRQFPERVDRRQAAAL